MLFWTDWGNKSKIERSNLDGSERKVLIKNLGWPNGLAIDFKNSQLYWIDAKDDILQVSDFEGSYREQVLERMPHPFGLTLVS